MVFMNTSLQIANDGGRGMAAPIDDEKAWRQLLSRDAEGAFFYAVTTTGVFCRLDCRSRLPLRENVRFFGTAEEARAAGFRACKKCAPAEGRPLDRVRAHIEKNLDQPLNINGLARIACLSRAHFIEKFHRETGFSPMAYVRKVRLEHAARAIMSSDVVLREIARQFGFRDEFQFSRVFRRTMGVAPGSLRTRNVN